MQRHSLKFLLLLSFFSFFETVSGQGGFNSPFSRFGFGDLVDRDFSFMRHMGGINAAYNDPYHINNANPASYSYLRTTSFDIGVSANNISLKDPENTQNFWSGNLEYLSLAFPLRNPLNEVLDRERRSYWLGMSFSLIPYSRVNYNIVNSFDNEEFGNIESQFQGTGGTYKVLWGNSIRYKNFAFGVNLGYLFGKINYERNINFIEPRAAFDNSFLNDFSVRGFTWNAGATYQYVLNREKVLDQIGVESRSLTFGLYGNSKQSFSTDATTFFQSVQVTNFVVSDTIFFQENVSGSGNLPAEIAFGVNYAQGGTLNLGLNYVLTNWSQYKNEANPEELSDGYKLSFGGFYRPNIKSFKYWNRVYYRFGTFYGKDPRSLENVSLSNYGLSMGLGLPFSFQRKISHVNLGLKVGRRGNTDILRETYVKLSMGITFNDNEWFIKRKYN